MYSCFLLILTLVLQYALFCKAETVFPFSRLFFFDSSSSTATTPTFTTSASTSSSQTSPTSSTSSSRLKRKLQSAFTNVNIVASAAGDKIKAVSIFPPTDREYHTYAAILACVTPFKRACEAEIKRSLGPINFAIHRLKGTSLSDPSSSVRLYNKAVDRACERYEKKVQDLVKAHGMELSVFNALSHTLSHDSMLKQKVLLQSYYYRIAADLQANTSPSSFLPTLPSIAMRPPSISEDEDTYIGWKGGSGRGMGDMLGGPSRFTRYCYALRRIEKERLTQRSLLQAELGIPSLPQLMCDPSLLPAMCPAVQAACSRFPQQVRQVLKHYDLSVEEFEKLTQRAQNDVIFRWRVGGECSRLERLALAEKIRREVKKDA